MKKDELTYDDGDRLGCGFTLVKIAIILLLVIFSVSCMTVKRIEKNCDKFAKICITDVKKSVEIITNTVTEIVYRDTIIYKYLPGKIVERKVTVYIDKGIVNSEQSRLSTPFAESTAQVVNSKLWHYLAQTDSTLQIEVENGLKTIKTQEKQIKTLREKYVVTVTKNNPFAKFTIKWFFGSLALIGIFLAIIVFRFKSKILGLFK